MTLIHELLLIEEEKSDTSWATPEWKKKLIEVTKSVIDNMKSIEGTKVSFNSGHGTPIKTEVVNVVIKGDKANLLNPDLFNHSAKHAIHRSLDGDITFANGDKMTISALVGKNELSWHYFFIKMSPYDVSLKNLPINIHDGPNIVKRAYPVLKSKEMSDQIRAAGEWHSKMPDPSNKDKFMKYLLKKYKDRHNVQGPQARSINRELRTYISHSRELGYDYPEFAAIEKSIGEK